MKAEFTNRLAAEKSPYLLQHAHNPVDWYPWGDEAFDRARREDKPVFLSIGYSTCHWCHVMEHESFEDSSVAALMNEAFINIKVDREERPDVDDIYMTVCQMLTGQGGWPLTIVMTPDKKPFFAATYIPKEDRFGRMGMLSMIPRIAAAWQEEREKLLGSAGEIVDALQNSASSTAGDLPAGLAETAAKQFASRFDAHFGGFNSKPKFPTAHNLMFLLRHHVRTGNPKALEMVETTLRMMRLGGVYDQVGFGFHRYSTDERWLVPHFEKMLYDQAILIMAYTEAWQVTGNEQYRRTAEEILEYVARDMSDPKGGFYSAEDADSEGEEGKFYVWSSAEVRQILTPDEAELFLRVYNFSEDGNFIEEATGHRMGTNIPHLLKPLNLLAADLNLSEEDFTARLEVARRKLFVERRKRIHPLKDDKILTDWNGLMIAACSKAAQAFAEERYAQMATRAADFVLSIMRGDDGRLMHRYREGDIAIPAYLDDYAFTIWGLLELYETTFDNAHLQAAVSLTRLTIGHFADEEKGAFYFTPDDGEKLLLRKKEIYDGAVPSGNSVMLLNLLRLGRILADPAMENRAQGIATAFGQSIGTYASAQSMTLIGLDFAAGPTSEIVIVGSPDDAATQAMLQALQKKFAPNTLVLLKYPGTGNDILTALAPFTKEMEMVDGKATAYVCQNYACEMPVTSVEAMLAILDKHAK